MDPTCHSFQSHAKTGLPAFGNFGLPAKSHGCNHAVPRMHRQWQIRNPGMSTRTPKISIDIQWTRIQRLEFALAEVYLESCDYANNEYRIWTWGTTVPQLLRKAPLWLPWQCACCCLISFAATRKNIVVEWSIMLYNYSWWFQKKTPIS